MTYLPQPQKTDWQQSDEFDAKRSAVLVVDVLGGSDGPTPGLEDMAANCVKIVKAARKASIPVIFANDAHIEGLDREIELWGEHGMRNTQGGTPLSEFEVCEGDFVIPKRRYNAFFQTDLDITLRELGVDTLVVIGCDTNICVTHTLAGAYFLGYKSIVASDATGTFLIGDQESGLAYFSRCYDSRVVTTDTVIEYFAS